MKKTNQNLNLDSRKGRKSGFTLIEFMFVVVLITIGSAVVAPKFLDNRDESLGKTEGEKVIEVKAKIEGHYSSLADYSGVDMAFPNIAPSSLTKTSSGVYNTAKEEILVSDDGSTGYTMDWPGVLKGVFCNSFINTTMTYWDEIDVDGTTITQSSKPDEVTTACSQNLSNKTETLDVQFITYN